MHDALQLAARCMQCTLTRTDAMPARIVRDTGDVLPGASHNRKITVPLTISLYTIEAVDERRDDLPTLIGLTRAQLEGMALQSEGVQ